MHVTATLRFLSKLDSVKDALSHARPGASTEDVLEACMDLLLAHSARRKGLVERPRAAVRPVTSGAIPADPRRGEARRVAPRRRPL